MLLPPTLVTGIFGMNTKGLPLTDAETGFLWAAAIMVGVAGAAYLAMRRLGHRQIERSAAVSRSCAAFFPAPVMAARGGCLSCVRASRARRRSRRHRPRPKDTREILADAGYQFSLTYIGEGLANISGGMRTGAIYTGRLDLGTTIDLEKVAGWTGATFHANMFQIHGDGLSRSYIGNLMLVSGVEALPATRLYEFWVEQKLLGGKLADPRRTAGLRHRIHRQHL